MRNVKKFAEWKPEIDLLMEVLGVLYCGEPMTCHEIASDIETHHQCRFDSAEFYVAIQRLRSLGYKVIEHHIPDGVSLYTQYELVTPEGAA